MTRIRVDDTSFARLARLLRATAGLSFDEGRRDSLAYSVGERLGVTGLPDVASYLDLLESPAGESERQALLDEVTIPETHFFRNPPQVRALRKFVLPQLLQQAADRRRLRIWSAGCATGEEPYTLAMLTRELLPPAAGWDLQVLATDVSNRALAAARDAAYTERSFVMTDPVDLARWFVIDATDGRYHLRDEVREMVEVRHHNLVTDPPPFEPGECDLILCRNVTIYFDRETTQRLMQRLHACLRPGGYLFLGHAETLWQVTDAFELASLGDAFVYRRPVPGEERRHVLPDRRTENELSPLRADRRRGGTDRRARAAGVADVTGATTVSDQWPSWPDSADAPGESEGLAGEEDRLPDGTVPDSNPAVGDPYPDEVVPVAAPADPMLAVRAALAAGRYAEVRDLLDDVIAADPLRAEAHYLQGLALTNLGKDAEAAVVLRRAVYLDPDSGFAHFLLGGALHRLGETVAAARCYRAAASTLGRRPKDAVAEELGGRSVAELAATCLRLAQQAEDEGRS